MRRQIVLVLASIVLAAPAAAIKPVDDFELGPFVFQTTGAYQQNDVFVTSAGHVLWSPRTVILEPQTGSDYVYAELAPTSGDDAAEVLIIGDGRVRFEYNWGFPADITANGVYDRVEVAFSFVTPGAYFSLGIGDASSGCSNERLPAATSGIVSWDLDNWCAGGIDETQAEWISLHLVANGSDAIFEVKDIRLRRSNSVIPDLDGHFVATQVPPIPSPPLAWSTYDWAGQPLYRTDLVLQNVDIFGSVPALSADFQWGDALGGETGAMTFQWDDQQPFDVTQFEMSVDFSPADGWTPQIVYPPDPFFDEEGLAILTGVEMRDGNGVARGTSWIRMVFTEGLQQDLRFENVMVVPAGSSKRGVGDGFTLSFTLEPVNVDDVFPLFDVSWISDWAPAQLTAVAAPDPTGVEAFTLVAAPSVTRSGTQIRASRPVPSPTSVEIFDVSGRIVRRLLMPRGAAVVTWDGRDGGGRPLAAGTYFAQTRAETARATARITRLR